MAQVAQW